MRPVKRNPWPKNKAGEKKEVTNYKGFYDDLIQNFGFYCSYCERPDGPDAEHVIPQGKPAGKNLSKDWKNLLLGCPKCNRDNKKNKNDNRKGYVWPDKEDTFLCYEYESTGNVRTSPHLSLKQKTKAQATLDLCGLAPQPDPNKKREPKDFLWNQRNQIWQLAENLKTLYLQQTYELDKLVLLAKTSGHWSVWGTVFWDCPKVVVAISKAFPGTRKEYTKLVSLPKIK